MQSMATRSWQVLLAVAAVSIAYSSPASAANLLVNGSFENTGGTFADEGGGVMNSTLTPGSGLVPGWTVTNAQLGWVSNANTFGISTPYGAYSLDLTGSHDDSSYAGVTQTIVTTPGVKYRLTLSLGADQSHPVNGGTKSVQVTTGASSTSFTFVPSGTGSQWGSFSFDFTASSTSTPIAIVGASAGSGSQYLGLDNASVDVAPQAVPVFGVFGGVILAGALGATALAAAASRRVVS